MNQSALINLALPALFGLGNPGTVALAITFLILFGIAGLMGRIWSSWISR